MCRTHRFASMFLSVSLSVVLAACGSATGDDDDDDDDIAGADAGGGAPDGDLSGDKIKTECTWFNSSGSTVTWGESSTAEMCFSILYRYPAGPSDSCVF